MNYQQIGNKTLAQINCDNSYNENRKFVLSEVPTAWSESDIAGKIQVLKRGGKVIAEGNSKEEAWQNAAEKLKGLK